jgi:hypothetical protein
MLKALALWLLTVTAAVAADVPLAAMSEANRVLVGPVIELCTLQRDYMARTFHGRRELFEFLMDDMVGCSMLSESLGLIGYRALEGEFGRAVADDRTGAQGYIQQVYCAEGKRAYYVEGTQQGMFQARGRGVVIVSFTETAPDRIEFTGQMFVKIDNEVLAILAQVFFAFVKKTVDEHFDHVINQPIYLSGLALEDAGTLRRSIESMSAEDYRRLTPLLRLLR